MDINELDNKLRVLRLIYDTVEIVYDSMAIVADGKETKLIDVSNNKEYLHWGKSDDKVKIEQFGTFFVMYEKPRDVPQEIDVFNAVTKLTNHYTSVIVSSEVHNLGNFILVFGQLSYDIVTFVNIEMNTVLILSTPHRLRVISENENYTWFGYKKFPGNEWHSGRINNLTFSIDIFDTIDIDKDSGISLIGTEYTPYGQVRKDEWWSGRLTEPTELSGKPLIEGVQYRLAINGCTKGKSYDYIQALDKNYELFRTYKRISNTSNNSGIRCSSSAKILEGLIDRNGVEILPPDFKNINRFTSDTFILEWEDNKYIYDVMQRKYLVGVPKEKFYVHYNLPVCLFVNAQDNTLYIFDAKKRIYKYSELPKYYNCEINNEYNYIMRVNIAPDGVKPIYKYVDTRLTPITNMYLINQCSNTTWRRI